MLSAAGICKNKLFRYLLDYVAKMDAEFTSSLPAPIPEDIKKPIWNKSESKWEEATDDNISEVPRFVFSISGMREYMDTIQVSQVIHYLLFIFLRDNKSRLSSGAQKRLEKDWNNVWTFNHEHTTYAGDIQYYVKDSCLAVSLYQEFEKSMEDIPVDYLHEICLYDSSKNMDGTYCYYLSQIGVMGNHIITTNMIKDLTRRQTVLKYIGDETSNKDIKRFTDRAEEFLLVGLDEKFNNIFELLTDMLTELKSWIKDPSFLLYDYARRVHPDIIVIQPNSALKVYKKIYEEEEK